MCVGDTISDGSSTKEVKLILVELHHLIDVLFDVLFLVLVESEVLCYV